jgi:hypothetical protein
VDQATIINYALGYIASIIVVFLLFLPTILSFVLLLLLAGAIQVVVLFLKAVFLGAYRGLAGLFRSLAAKLPHGRGGGGLVPH